MGVVKTNFEKVLTESVGNPDMALWICERIVEAIPGSALVALSGFASGTRVTFERCITLPGTNLALFIDVYRSSTLADSTHRFRITVGTYVENVITLGDVSTTIFISDSYGCSAGDVFTVTHNLVNDKLHCIIIKRNNSYIHIYMGTWVSQYDGTEYIVVSNGVAHCTVPTTVFHTVLADYAGSPDEYAPNDMAIMLPLLMYATTLHMGDPLISDKTLYYCPQIAGTIGRKYKVGEKTFMCVMQTNWYIEI